MHSDSIILIILVLFHLLHGAIVDLAHVLDTTLALLCFSNYVTGVDWGHLLIDHLMDRLNACVLTVVHTNTLTRFGD